MVKKILLGALVVVVLVCAGGGLWLYNAVNAPVDEHFAGHCEAVSLPGSAEDIQIDRERGFAYLSVLDRLGVAKGETIDPGMVMRLDLNTPGYPVSPALRGGPELHPHGLSLFRNVDGRMSLFVINHPADRENGREAIELYRESETPGVFDHVESFASPLITRANDIVAVGPREFYVAQDVDRTSGATHTDLVYFDGTGYRVVADDIASGGGINVSADGNTLYISETGAQAIRVARRNPDGTITTLRSVPLESAPGVLTSPDNIDVAEDGSLWVGAHSNIVALAMHFIAGSHAPTQILRVDPNRDPAVIEEIYLDAGDEISAGSGGATLGNRLLIGSITARKVLVCVGSFSPG